MFFGAERLEFRHPNQVHSDEMDGVRNA